MAAGTAAEAAAGRVTIIIRYGFLMHFWQANTAATQVRL